MSTSMEQYVGQWSEPCTYHTNHGGRTCQQLWETAPSSIDKGLDLWHDVRFQQFRGVSLRIFDLPLLEWEAA